MDLLAMPYVGCLALGQESKKVARYFAMMQSAFPVDNLKASLLWTCLGDHIEANWESSPNQFEALGATFNAMADGADQDQNHLNVFLQFVSCSTQLSRPTHSLFIKL
jgi:hypothetical protein